MYATTSSKLPWAMGFFAALLLWPSVNFAQVATSFSGDALAAKGNIGAAPAFDVDHLTLPSTGGNLSLSEPLPQPLPGGGCVGACGEVGPGIVLSTVGSGASTLSNADVDQFIVTVGSHTIIASGFSNSATASCPVNLGDKALVSSSGFVAEVNIDQTFDSTTLFPGGMLDTQTFPLGPSGVDGTVIVNQIPSSTATSTGGDIIINALQILTPSGDEIVVASSHAGVTCPKATGGGGNGGCPGKVTGGGVFMLNNQRQTFGFVAGTKKDGTSFGNFNYVNHGTKDHLQGNVESVTIDNSAVPPTATVTGTLKTGGAYTLVVVDAGEPGRADTFNLISGTVNTGGPIALDPRGGNIQIHKGCGVGSSH
jgi:hypothetical protein